MPMQTITRVVNIREGDGKAKLDFQNTWKIFLDFWSKGYNKKKMHLQWELR